MSKPEIIVSTNQLADFFEVTRNTISRWNEAGCPKEGRGRWNLKDVYDWYWENIAAERAAQESGDESLTEARRKYWWQKARGEEMRNERESGRLIPKENVVREWAFRVTQVAEGLSAFSKRLPPLLEGKTQAEMCRILEDEAWKLRDNFTRTGEFCPPEGTEQGLSQARTGGKNQAQGKSKKGSGGSKKAGSSQAKNKTGSK
jgi:phage terminase Nu1 subunit (DNA packaging protein)